MTFVEHINWIIDNPRHHRFIISKIIPQEVDGKWNDTESLVLMIWWTDKVGIYEEAFLKHTLYWNNKSDEVQNEYQQVVGKISDFNIEKLQKFLEENPKYGDIRDTKFDMLS